MKIPLPDDFMYRLKGYVPLNFDTHERFASLLDEEGELLDDIDEEILEKLDDRLADIGDVPEDELLAMIEEELGDYSTEEE